MKIINAKIHGYLDYGVVLVFLAAPSLFHFSGIPAVIAYSLAGIHLALTLLSDFPLGVLKVIPLKWHGIIEMIVGPVLVVLPFALGFGSQPTAQYFYCVNGILILVIWFLTDYGKTNKA